MRRRTPTPFHAEMVRQGRMSKWLAAEIGASEPEVSRWRHGVHIPEADTQAKIAEALCRPVADLFPVHPPVIGSADETPQAA